MVHRMILAPALLAGLLFGGGCDDATEPGPAAISFEPAYAFTALAADDFITDFDFAPDGTLWVTTFYGAIIRVADGEQTTYLAGAIAGTGATARDLFIDAQGRPWIATAGVVAVYDAGEWRVEGPPDLMGLAPKAQAVAVAGGEVLVGMGDVDAGGLLLRRGGSWDVLTPATSSLESPLTEDIAVGPDGSFWVAHGTYQGRGGVARVVDGAIAATYTTDDGLLYNHVSALAIGDGRVWIGYQAFPFWGDAGPDGGIQAMPLEGGAPETWFPHETGRVSSRVASLDWTSAGELWFTTTVDDEPTECPDCFAGVGYLTDTAIRAVSHPDADLAPYEFLTRIREGPDGEIYVALGARKEVARVVR